MKAALRMKKVLGVLAPIALVVVAVLIWHDHAAASVSTQTAPGSGSREGFGQQPAKPRQLRRQPEKPIDAQLLPTDRDVELLDFGFSPGLMVVDESGKVLETAARAYDLIAIVTIVGITSELTPDRTWVTSTVKAKIVDLLKSGPTTTERYVIGGELEFPWEGGTVAIDQSQVNARISTARPLHRGRDYLVFGWLAERSLRIPLQQTYEINGARLRGVFTGASSRDDIESDTLDNVKTRVRAVTGGR